MENAERWVRDLCWAVNSPSLLGESALLRGSENASLGVWQLRPEDVDREHLSRELSERFPRRTGRYFERLILYWLEHLRGCRLVAHGLQVRDDNRTVGEIDVLFRDEHDRLTHWELAVKFYLQVAPGKTAASDYVGPNVRDTLERKTRRLVEHQLRLSERYFPDVEVRQAFVKGRIFTPWQTRPATLEPKRAGVSERFSPVLADDHLRGRWIRHGDAATAFATDDLHCRVLKKPYWLADQTAQASGDAMFSSGECVVFLKNHFDNRPGPVLLSRCRMGSPAPEPAQPLFVVPDHWPNLHEED